MKVRDKAAGSVIETKERMEKVRMETENKTVFELFFKALFSRLRPFLSIKARHNVLNVA